MQIRRFVLAALLAACALPALAQGTRLLRHPDVSEDHVVFAYGGDLWIADRDGGDARRLTSFAGVEQTPRFSPDGRTVAFSGQYDGNVDVFTVPIEGGEPRRLTWHPGPDIARGWSNDGRRVIFASGRTGAPIGFPRFWSVSRDGDFPEPLPMPRAWSGQYSPDGRHLAYEMVQSWESEWRNYRGGQNKPIWVLDVDDLSVEKLPWKGSNDNTPVYVGDTIYFLSDRDYAMNVWKYDATSREVVQVTRFKDYDVKNLESGGGALVFEQGGYVWLLEPDAPRARPRQLEITVRGDFPWARPHWEDASAALDQPALSPGGKRAVFEARGEIFTVPAEKGDVRNLTASPGVADRRPAWSPDGKHISWFSDEGGEYGLVIADQFGGDRRSIELKSPTFFYTPVWSPDSKHLAFGDADRVLWVLEVESGKARRVDEEGYAHPIRTIYPEWSPDSKWIAYTKRLDNQYNAVWVYSLESRETQPISDGMSDCVTPAWDKSGKYLSMACSTDYGLNVGWLDMTSYQKPITRAIYMAVLAADTPSPLLPESDDEEVKEEEGEKNDDEPDEGEKKKEKKKKGDGKDDGDEEEDEEEPPVVTIDFDGLGERILSLGVAPGNYVGIVAGAEGVLFYFENLPNGPGGKVHRYKLEDRESEEFLAGVVGIVVSHDGEKVLYSAPGDTWGIVDAGGKAKVGDGKLDLSGVRTKVDPAAEWRQIFREAWRYQRDYFYVENVHGLDLDEAWKMYEPWIDHVRHRSDLTHVLDILGGETAVGHSFTGGGDNPDVEQVQVGLLGADYEIANGRYRFATIYDGENWNPGERAPLRGPGIDVEVGDYLLAVDGVELTSDQNPYSLFDRKAGRQVRLTLGPGPERNDESRDVTVVPVASEGALRRRAWVEGNRRKVDELSGGRLAYVWLPNTGLGGYTYFNRYYFAQIDKQGAVVDERFNGGGSAADYMVDLMARPLTGYFNNPLGEKKPFTNPNAGIWGPKVMIINDAAGSGGDLLPYMFRARNIGPLVGTRTWGGLVGIWDVPSLIDGGFITAPRGGFFDNEGKWAVENEGVPPDIEVEQLPAEVHAGHDPQLEKAVEVALELLEENPVELKSQPPDPVRVRRPR